jgi:predicted nuclease of restriction endonuclease-like (RecB) superfamily
MVLSLFYNEHNTIGQQAVGQLEATEDLQQLVTQIPWGHNLRIISKCKSVEKVIFYIHKTLLTSHDYCQLYKVTWPHKL